MSRPWFRFAVAVLVGATAISAQQTWVVDRSIGPGTHFTDLPAAEAAASPGDTILVRFGIYTSFATSKGLRILGEGLPRIFNFTSGQPCVIRQLPAGQSVTLAGFLISPTAPTHTALRLENCQGRVHLDQVVVLALGGSPVPAIEVDGCRAVSMSGVTSNGAPALVVRNSELAMQSCSATGQTVDFPPPVAFPAASLDSTRLTATNCSFLAQGGGPMTIAAPGIQMASAQAAFTRGPAASIGASLVGASPTPAIFGTGTVFLDPGMTVRPLGGAPRVLGVVEVPRRLPGQWLQHTSLVVHGAVTAAAGSPFVTLLGRPGNPTATPFPDVLWLDPGLLLVAAVGVVDSTELFPLSFPIPASLPPRTLLGFQTVGGPMNDLHLSPPAVLVLR